MSSPHPLAGTRILVTGAEGRIGTAVCARLAAAGVCVTGLSLPVQDRPTPDTIDRVVHGDATDEAAVEEALTDAEYVVHLAAIPSPLGHPPYTVFRTNTDATFNVLNQAAERGIRRAVIASSINATGLPFNSHEVRPAYYPLDEAMPSDLDDAYALSKYVDEITARMVHRHWGMNVIALRFPFTAEREYIEQQHQHLIDDPAAAVVEGWSYLDVRDAALAVERSLLCTVPGAHPVFVAADLTLAPYPTEDLLDRFAPGVPRNRTFVDREVPIDLTRARTLLGFRAEYPLEQETRPLP